MVGAKTVLLWERSEAGRLAISTALVAFTSWLGIVILRPGDQFSAIWPPNGVLLAFVVTARRKYWAAYLGLGLCVNVAIHCYTGTSSGNRVTLAFADGLEVLVAALAFWKSAPSRPDLTDVRTLIRFTIFASVLGPLASALWVLWQGNHNETGTPMIVTFRSWFVADGLGLLLFTPLMLAFLDPELIMLFKGKRLAETAGWLSALSAVAFLVFRNDDFPFPFALIVALIPLIFRLGPAGSAVGLLVIAFPATHYTFADRGPLARFDLYYWSFLLQIYLLILLTLVYVLSAVLAKKERLALALRTSEMRYRVLAETSQDIILRTTVDGVRTYVSPSLFEVTGWTEEELPPRQNTAVLVHPADREKFTTFLERLPTQAGRHTLVYRGKKRDGNYGWLEAYVGRVAGQSLMADELVWTIRDISLRVAHEERLRSEKQRAEELASTDGLTGLKNRRAFDERLAAEWTAAAERQSPLSLLLLDVDFFKSYNDNYGHQAGDECLRQIAQVIGDCVREPFDLAARYGGEEFAVILPYADLVRAEEVGERIRREIEALALLHEHSPHGKITLSAGVASFRHADQAATETLVAAADRALYDAKGEGRNRVVLAPM